ncbi:hypothetical protein E2562_036611 [Oryza meyeriana var. granulata]|uniref:Uncharacterized protein n=1 Tax=Oryza meyeriana var. granulata TaxID=110450 RepID=A0A6G1BQH3_9ORYZ|nr:hypothetical protein E2562_036611 [Oryza meyeriana var. granulata]
MAASQTTSSHGVGEGGCIDQLRDMVGFLGFTLPEYASYTLFNQPPHCELTMHIYPRGGTHGISLHQDPSHRSAGLPDALATQLDLLLEAYHSLARHSAALRRPLAEEGVTSVDTTSWDSGHLCHSLTQSFYSSHGSADKPNETRTPSSRVPYLPYFSPRPRHRNPPYTLGYSPVTSRRGLHLIRTARKSVAGPSTLVFRFTPTLAGPAAGPSRQVPAYLPYAPINVSSTNEPTTDADQSKEL